MPKMCFRAASLASVRRRYVVFRLLFDSCVLIDERTAMDHLVWIDCRVLVDCCILIDYHSSFILRSVIRI